MTTLPALAHRPALPLSISGRVLSGLLSLVAAIPLGCASTPPAVPTAAAAAGVGELRLGVALEREVPAGGKDELPLELIAGSYLRFTLLPEDLDLVVSVLGPDGEAVVTTEGLDRLSVIPAVTGPHRLAVAPRGGAVRYRISLAELRPARSQDFGHLAAEAALSAAARLRNEGHYAEAIDQAQEALCWSREAGDHDNEFNALYRVGSVHFASLRKEEAAYWYGEALRTARSAGNVRGSARALSALGSALFDIDPGQARLCFEDALLIWEELADVSRQAKELYLLAYLSANLGKSEEALTAYKKALSLAEAVGDLRLGADIWNGMGAVHAARGESKEALDRFERALRLARDARSERAEAAILTGFGMLHRRRGEPQKALTKLQEALDINRQLKELGGEVRVRNHLGPVYMDLGQPGKAREEYGKSLELLRSGDGDATWIANTLLNIGQVDLKTNQLREALDHFEEALRISRQAGGSRDAVALHYIGVTQLRLGQVGEAIQSLESSLALRRQGGDRPGEASTLLELGKAWQTLGDLDRAAPLMREGLQLAGGVGASFTQAASHYELARLERDRGNLQEALTHIEQAIAILESVRSDLSDDRLRSSFFSSKRSYYDFYVDLLMRLERLSPGQGYADKALGASEMAHARSLLDLLAEGRLDLTRGIAPDLKQKESDVSARLSQIQRQLVDELSGKARRPIVEALRARLDETEEERRKIELQIKTDHPLYAQVRYPAPLRREQIQERLDGDSAFLEYSLGAEAAYFFVVTREDLKVFALPPSQHLAEEVRKVRAEVEKPGLLSFSYRRAAHGLYRLIVAPARAVLAGKQRLLIAPDGALHFLSFETLLSGDSRGDSTLPFLLREFSISYVPSASVLSWLSLPRSPVADRGEPRKEFLAFADPDYHSYAPETRTETADEEIDRGTSGGWRFSRLEGSEREVSAIASRYPAAAVQIYRGREANEENVKDNGLVEMARRIHFATHGVLDEERPEFSGLALTRTENPADDGFLRVYEIFNLNLSCDLVVLSACESGLGDEVAGEGLVGLTRAFLYAGTPSVVVSLWRVADAAAPDLMVEFYDNLDRSGNKSESLRRSKLAMLQRRGKFAHPYYWAPFVLVGSPE